jgi:hypothetical protein
MDANQAPQAARPRPRLNIYVRALRREGIFSRLRLGAPYEDIARDEGLTERRVRPIVAGALKRQAVDDERDRAPPLRGAKGARAGCLVRSLQALEKAQNGNGRLLESWHWIWRWRRAGLGLAPRRLGVGAAPTWVADPPGGCRRAPRTQCIGASHGKDCLLPNKP